MGHAWVAQLVLAWVAQLVLAWVAQLVLEEGGKREAEGLRLEEGVRVSCLLRQPRYQVQEVRVPFQRIGGWFASSGVGYQRVSLYRSYVLPSSKPVQLDYKKGA